MGRRLVPVRSPREPEGVVVVLHGGASRGEQVMVSPAQLSVLRMVPVAHRIARTGRSRLAVHRLLNSHRGWDSRTSPVMDALWAVDQLADQHPDVPLALVGHSLGGRAALLTGGDPRVRSVVALNPWVLPTDRVDLAGTRVLVVHGTDDRVAPPARSADLARRLALSASVGYVSVPGAKHAMLGQGRTFETYAAEFVAATLLGARPRSEAVRQVLDGDSYVEA
ncbi:alpha/beta hydrolase [Alloalcanivorax gelatiniphagus]